jgi:hypothetical protein
MNTSGQKAPPSLFNVPEQFQHLIPSKQLAIDALLQKSLPPSSSNFTLSKVDVWISADAPSKWDLTHLLEILRTRPLPPKDTIKNVRLLFEAEWPKGAQSIWTDWQSQRMTQ